MRLSRQLPIVAAALGAVACTALLGDFDVAPGGTTNVGDSGGGGDGTVSGPVAITPGESKIGILRAQKYTATEDVTWSLKEAGAAGTIDETGLFIAGPTPGTYNVVATSKADPAKTATVPVVVVNLGVVVLLGTGGGPGNIDGPAQKAHFNGPEGLAISYSNSSGDWQLFIADTQNHTIRFYDDKTKQVTTLAGRAGVSGTLDGVGDAARFDEPRLVAVDPGQKIAYVVDSNGTCIRGVNAANGNVTTVSGSCGTGGTANGTPGTPPTRALLQNVGGIAMSGDRSSALYVCDSQKLRRIELASANARGTAQDMLPSGTYCSNVAVDHWSGGFSEKNVWFTSGLALHRFPEPNPATWPVGAATITDMQASLPDYAESMGISTGVGNEDHLYASNRSRSVVYRLGPGVAYNAPPLPIGTNPWLGADNDRRWVDGPQANARLSGPGQVAPFPQYGDVLVADARAGAIRRIGNGQVTSPVGSPRVTGLVDGARNVARLTGPMAVAADEAGMIYFGDIAFDSAELNCTIRKFDRATATASPVSGLPTRPFDVANPPTDGPKELARFWFPIDMTYAGGKLFVVDNFGQGVRRVDTKTGAVDTLAGELTVPGNSDGTGAAAHFKFVDGASGSGAGGIFGGAITTDGTSLYVADSGNHAIRKITIATGQTTTVAGGTQGSANGNGKAAQFVNPVGLAIDGGNLFIADWMDHTIRRMNLATGVVDGFLGLSGQAGDKDGDAATATLNFPFRLAADGLGNLYVAELPILGQYPSGIVRRIDIKGRRITPFAGSPGKVGLQTGPIPSTLNCPTALAVLPSKDLFFGDFCSASLGAFLPL
jgi:hypothetical protein